MQEQSLSFVMPETRPAPRIYQEKPENKVARYEVMIDRSKCTVCGADVAPNSAEGLCWVCRRLKISAWHESEQPTPAPE